MTRSQGHAHHVKSMYLINYFRYLHWRLDLPVTSISLHTDMPALCRDGWVKGAYIPMVSVKGCNHGDEHVSRQLFIEAA